MRHESISAANTLEQQDGYSMVWRAVGSMRWRALIGILLLAICSTAQSGVLINEIFFDPPGNETQREYVELRGDVPNLSLANHWLIVLEGEGNLEPDMSEVGQIDTAIDLSGFSLGANGFLVMRRTGNPYSIDAQSADVQLPTALFENSGGTFMLINQGTGPTPTVGMRLDGLVDNDGNDATVFDGLDFPNEGQPGWSILDAIGVVSEKDEIGLSRLYAQVNFSPERDGFTFPPDFGGAFNAADHLEPGAVYVSTNFENEIFARYGNSTGQGERDWHITNVTDNGLAGASAAAGRFAQAGSDPHGFPREPLGEGQYSPTPDCNYACYLANYHTSESSQYVPYGTPITTTLGSANYPLNLTQLPWDFNQNGVVDAADYTVWRDTLGQIDPSPGTEFDGNPATNPLAANANRSNAVDMADYAAWKWHFGESLPTMAGGGAVAVPEPASWLLAALGAGVFAARRRKL
jgi:hypothetical protein